MKTTIILLVSGLLTALAFWLVWMNRASEKILTAILPVAAATLAAVFIAVFVFGGEPTITSVFPSSFLYRLNSKMPANLPWTLTSRRFSSAQFAPAMLFAVHPEVFSNPADEEGQLLYHHLLQRAIIDWMGMTYPSTWQVELLNFDLPSGREWRFQPIEGASAKSEVLSTEQLGKLLKGNLFSEVNSGIPPRIALPLGTKLTITAPDGKSAGLEIGRIVLTNKFCTISIKTESASWFRGIGAYKQLAGMTDEQVNLLGTANYIVRINVEFNRWRSNHPEMALYKSWANDLLRGLQAQFDEQVIWSKTKEDFAFSQMKGQFVEQPLMHQATISSGAAVKDVVIDPTAKKDPPLIESH